MEQGNREQEKGTGRVDPPSRSARFPSLSTSFPRLPSRGLPSPVVPMRRHFVLASQSSHSAPPPSRRAGEDRTTAAYHRIKTEERDRSQVMEIASSLTTSSVRPTHSVSQREGRRRLDGEELNELGHEPNAKMESLGARSDGLVERAQTRRSFRPAQFPIIGSAARGRLGRNGSAKAEVVIDESGQRSRPGEIPWQPSRQDRLHAARREIRCHLTSLPDASRLADTSLSKLAEAPFTPDRRRGRRDRTRATSQRAFRPHRNFSDQLAAFLADEGAVSPSSPGWPGRRWHRVHRRELVLATSKNPTKVPGLISSTEHYGGIARMVEKVNSPGDRVEPDVKNTFTMTTRTRSTLSPTFPDRPPKLKDEKLAMLVRTLTRGRHRRDRQRCRILAMLEAHYPASPRIRQRCRSRRCRCATSRNVRRA